MSRAPSTLRSLQEAVTERLRGSAHLRALKIYDRRDGDVENAVKVQLSTIGITLFVSPVLPRGISPNVPALCFERGEFTVRILEQPTTNQTGVDAYAAAELVLRRLHHWTPGVRDAGPITADPDPLDDNSDKSRTIFDLLFHVSGSFEAGLD